MSNNAKAIRNRMKSVESTMHITKAMQLVASSKIKHAQEQMNESKYFFQYVQDLFQGIASNENSSIYFENKEHFENELLIVIAGDRGLAGGYNNNIYRQVKEYRAQNDTKCSFVCIGKRPSDYYTRHGENVVKTYSSVEKMTMEECLELSEWSKEQFDLGTYDRLTLFYTNFDSALSQTVKLQVLLPIESEKQEVPNEAMLEYEPSKEAVLNSIIPQYLTGVLFGAIKISYTSEIAARRNAMDSATKNAKEMMDHLSLSYNRARQAAITQEITEIVAGANH